MSLCRYAIYFVPGGAVGAFGAKWLGWDVGAVTQPDRMVIEGLPRPREILTKAARKYGLHATLKAPFALAEDRQEADLVSSFKSFCKAQKPVCAGQLKFSHGGGFLSLRPSPPLHGLNQLAQQCVISFDPFRKAATTKELERRRKANLTPAQDHLLQRWGYPYVMDEFRFHITLTGRVDDSEAEQITNALKPALDPLLSDPFIINELALAAERADGQFCILERANLLA